ncbi:MAG: lantibiotic dehydratase, partial [Thermoanaerobaculia bacterium]
MIVRIAGAPFDELERLRAAGALHALTHLRTESASLTRDVHALCELLFTRVAGEVDDRLRKALIDTKRNLFNDRGVSAEALRRIAESDASLAWEVSAILERRSALATLERELERRFADELTSLRRILVELASQPLVQRGLVLSSRNLLQSFETFYRHRAAGTLNSKDVDVEIGITKYLARIHAKTSPFSTFTNIACGRLSDDDDAFGASGAAELVGDAPRVVVHTSINHLVIRFAREVLLRDPATRAVLPLRLNPTLRREQAHYRFLTNSSNLEAYQRLGLHPVIDLVIDIVSSNEATFGDAIARLCALPQLDMTADALAVLLDELIAIGLLECDVPVSALDHDWITAFRRFAAVSPNAAAMVEALEELQAMAARFAEADAAERQALLDAARARFAFASAEETTQTQSTNVFRRSDFAAVQLPQNLFYEDALLDGGPRVSRRAFASIAARIDSFARRLGRFDVFDRDRARYRDFFLAHYGAGATVELTRFHEDFSRQRMSGPSAAANVSHDAWLDELGRRSMQGVVNGVVHVSD